MLMLPLQHAQTGGLNMTNVDLPRALILGRVRDIFRGQRIVFLDQGFWSVIEKAKLLAEVYQIAMEEDCELGGYVNFWSIPAKTDMIYKPMYHLMAHEADRLGAWLTRKDGTRVIGWGGMTPTPDDDWYLWDVTNPAMRKFAARQFYEFRQKYRLGRCIADEAHAGLWSIVRGKTDAEKEADRALIPVQDLDWSDSVDSLSRQGGSGYVPNGTQGLKPDKTGTDGRPVFEWPGGVAGLFIQNGVTDPPKKPGETVRATISKCLQAHTGMPESGRPIVIQDSYQPDGGLFLVATAACLGAVAQQCDPAFRSAFNPNPYVRGAWGRLLNTSWDGSLLIGTFDRAEVIVSIDNRQVTVKDLLEDDGTLMVAA